MIAKGIGLRVIVDLILLNFSLAAGYFIGGLWQAIFGSAHGREYLSDFFAKIPFAGWSFFSLSLLGIVVFAFNGFYTKGRFYQGRYKALAIFQAVSLLFLMVAVISFFTGLTIPRSALISAWLVALCMVGGSRLWSLLWRKVVMAIEHPSHHPALDERHVLVIGGGGYIGSALLPKLLDKGYKVRLLDNFVYGEEPIAAYRGHPNLEVIKADFRQVDKIVEALPGIGSVIHLGAIVGDPACALDESMTIEINLMATKMIAEACKGYGIRKFIFASTCSVYGASDEVLNEKSKLNPVSLYARSKIACEQVLLQLADEDFSPVILRFSTIFGLSGRTRFDLVVNLLTAKAKIEGKITLYGGDQWRPFLHVDDAALSVFRALEAPVEQVKNEIFNVGGEHLNYTLGQVADVIKKQVPDAEILELGQDGDRRNYRVDFSKIKQRLGFVPKWTLDEGVAQVVEAIDEGKVTDYQDMRFNNAKFLTETGESRLVRRHLQKVLDMVQHKETV